MRAPVYLPPVEFIPSSELAVGRRYVRFDHCVKCKQDTTHIFIVRSVSPRFFVYECQSCKRPDASEDENT